MRRWAVLAACLVCLGGVRAQAQQTYVVREGDTLCSIAREAYGDAQEYPRIFQENRDVIGDDPNRIYAGQVLVLPELPRGQTPEIKNGVCEIADVQSLMLLRDGVNSGSPEWNGVTVLLTADLDLSSACRQAGGWEPIGTQAHPFTGVFDGQGHAVTGMTIDRKETDHQGLLGDAAKAQVKNVRVLNCAVAGGENTGAVAGRAKAVIDCEATGSVSGKACTGGVVGLAEEVTRSAFTGSVAGGKLTGGVAGKSGTARRCRAAVELNGAQAAGGVIGFCAGLTEHCSAKGTITSTAWRQGNDAPCSGGVAGFAWGDVRLCTFSGSVTGTENVGGIVGAFRDMSRDEGPYPEVYGCAAQAQVRGAPEGWVTGGIMGRGYRAVNCFATGRVEGGLCVGGVAGDLSDTALFTTEPLTLTNCMFSGDVYGAGPYTGGVAGRAICEAAWCNFLGTVEGAHTVGGIAGHGPDLVRNCIAHGEVLSHSAFAGGIVGQVGRIVDMESDGYRRMVKDCRFSGAVTGGNCTGGISGDAQVLEGCTAQAQVNGKDMVGGIAGRAWFDREGMELRDGKTTGCFFRGEVNGGTDVGGIAGTGFVLKDCRAYGAVDGMWQVGGIAGHAYAVADCTARMDIRGSFQVGGIVGNVYYAVANCDAGGTMECELAGGIAGMVSGIQPQDLRKIRFERLLPYTPLPGVYGCTLRDEMAARKPVLASWLLFI